MHPKYWGGKSDEKDVISLVRGDKWKALIGVKTTKHLVNLILAVGYNVRLAAHY